MGYMARPLRIEFEKAFYHITSRGNEKKKIFLDEYDKNKFLEIIDDLYLKYCFVVYAYVLMDNHYHLLLETPLPNLSRIMQDLGSHYTQYFNSRHLRVGHLFQGRYKSILVDKENYLLTLSRYIHLNPVRANKIKFPEKYEWSSLKYFKDCIKTPQWLNTKYILNEFNSYEKYLKFIHGGIKNTNNPFEQVYSQFILGEASYIKKIIEKIDIDQKNNAEISFCKEIRKTITADEISKVILQYFNVGADIFIKSKNKNNLARKFYIYFLRKYTALPLKVLSKKLGCITNTAITKSYNRFLTEIEKNKEHKKTAVALEKKIQNMSYVSG